MPNTHILREVFRNAKNFILQFARKVPQGILLALGSIFVLFLVIFIATFIVGKSLRLPKEFVEFERAAANISKSIVDKTNLTNEKIKNANDFDFIGDRNRTLAMIDEARKSNNEAHTQAFDLSKYLQKMAESLNKFESTEGKIKAYEAVTIELSLVNEFLGYTESLNNFLDTLTNAVNNNNETNRNLVKDRLAAVNIGARNINTLNQEFLIRIQSFRNY